MEPPAVERPQAIPIKPMKTKLALLALAVPAASGAVVVFHPGVAFAETPLAQGTPQDLNKPGTYTADPMHTSVGFDIGHLGISRVQGRFEKVSGKLNVDPKNVEKSSVTFTIAVDSVNTAVAPRDAHLKSKDYFDATTYPEITFVSSKIAKKGKGYVATGSLTIHGTTKIVEIPFEAFGPIYTEMGGTRVGIVSAPLKLSRTAFGVGAPGAGLSDDVTVRLSLEATQDK